MASGAGVIGYFIAIRHPEKVQVLLTACATAGSYDHPLIGMFEREEGKSAMVAPSVARIGSMFAAGMAQDMIVGDLMTANN